MGPGRCVCAGVWALVCAKSQTRKMIVCGFLKALARRHRKYFIFDLLRAWRVWRVWRCVSVRGIMGAGGRGVACAVIRQPASPHWQAWGLGGSNLGRSFGERRIASFHRGAWGVLAQCSNRRQAPCTPLLLWARRLVGQRLGRPAKGGAGCHDTGLQRVRVAGRGVCACSVGAVGHLYFIFNSVSKSEAELNMVFVIRCGAGGLG